MINNFKFYKTNALLFMIVGSILSACANYEYQYYTKDGKNWATKCTYKDSTYFFNEKQTKLNKELGYVVVQNRDIRGGWSCLLTFSNHTIIIIHPGFRFYIRNHPEKLKLSEVNENTYNKLYLEKDNRYIKVISH